MSTKITTVTYEEFTDYQFAPPATFYVMDSLQNYLFIHTSKRSVAQEWCDEYFGKGRYTVKAAKEQKTKIKNEAGIYTCTGTSSRRGQKR